ncbi:MAG TPA: pectinesterase family protein [Clostridia bacterium]|nr:pectinesterase family protein [Clostridia bacterium]
MLRVSVPPGASINEALAGLPATGEAKLLLSSAVYREKIEVARPRTRIVGVSPEHTRIEWSDCANAFHPLDGLQYNTFRTATLRVTADDVVLENLTVANTAGDPAKNGQCVALYAYGDRFLARNCRFASTQDTLFAGPLPDDLIVRYGGFLPDAARYREGTLRQRYEDCEIAGSVDFIFGCANALFLRCRLVSLFDGRDGGYVAAPAHSLKQSVGFVFLACAFSGEGVSDGSVFLARPWRDFGKADFIRCRLESHVAPALFDPWEGTSRDRTARFGVLDPSGRPLAPVAWCRGLSAEQAAFLKANAGF